jgi:hypothetical protein
MSEAVKDNAPEVSSQGDEFTASTIGGDQPGYQFYASTVTPECAELAAQRLINSRFRIMDFIKQHES